MTRLYLDIEVSGKRAFILYIPSYERNVRKLAEVGLDRVYTPTRVSGTTAIWTQWNKSREAKKGKKIR